MDQKYFVQPFGNAGDQIVIPDPIQGSGSVSFTQGWPFNYQRDLATDPAALPIDRATMNYLFYVITQQLLQYQQHGVPEWISPANNGGTAYAYAKNSFIRYSATVPGVIFETYVSLIDGNTDTPGATANWQPVSAQVATSAQASAGTDNRNIITSLLLAQQTNLRALLAGSSSQVFNVGTATAPTQALQNQQYVRPNKLLNPFFQVNQRQYASGTVLALNAYGLDCWQASTASSSMTFTANVQGQQVTIAGSFKNTIESTEMDPGTYTLSWSGTSQARVYNQGGSAPAYAASPITLSVSGTTHVVVELNAGTVNVGNTGVKMELNSFPTPAYRDDFEVAQAKCQRRGFPISLAQFQGSYGGAGTYIAITAAGPVSLRANPSITLPSGNFTAGKSGVGTISTTNGSPSIGSVSSNVVSFNLNGNWAAASGGVVNAGDMVVITATTGVTYFSADF